MIRCNGTVMPDNGIRRCNTETARGGEEVFNEFKQRLSDELGGGVHVSLFWKGRVALYAILKAMGVGEGDEVIVPGFTCVVVPNAVMYLGGKPVYADVERDTYTVTRETIEPHITERTRAIIAQNTYGLSPDLDSIIEMADERGIEVIDDCAHGFGGTYKGRPNGSITRSSFFSTQWNKPLSTGIGGFTATSDPVLAEKIAQVEAAARPPGAREIVGLRMLYAARTRIMSPTRYWKLVKLYRWLSSTGLVTGSSDSSEINGTVMPGAFVKRGSLFQARTVLSSLECFEASKAFRRALAVEYDETLARLGKRRPARPEYAGHLFLKYPVRVADRDEIFRKAERRNIRIGDWFLSPLHPVRGDLSPWLYKWGSCPVAESLSREVINLPTDIDMSPNEVEQVKDFVRGNRDYLV